MAAAANTALPVLRLSPNPVRRQHYGPGTLIQSFREPFDSEPAAEDWLSSDVRPRSAAPESTVGLARVIDEGDGTTTSLADLIAQDPVGILGVSPTAATPRIGYLAKLLCPDRRIPVHCHPDGAFASKWLPSPYGKTEAWVVLAVDGEEHPNAWIGLNRSMSRDEWGQLIAGQDADMLLKSLHAFTLSAGDVAFVPAGIPHTMGPGMLVFEPQQPSDWSILAEYEPFSLNDAQATIGLGWEHALDAFDLRRLSRDAAETAYIRRGALDGLAEGATALLPEESAGYFRVAAIRVTSRYESRPGSCWTGVVIKGSGRIETAGGSIDCRSGLSFFVPAQANPATIVSTEGELVVLAMAAPDRDAPWT